ncbi:hypothetical protein ACIBED_08800 [Rhodococcus coprophilus]|uniref:DUF7373 family lipoprotein n=1 Tax=Rhodococcus coprophilus TaxID=38310 RepID=UPI0033E85842
MPISRTPRAVLALAAVATVTVAGCTSGTDADSQIDNSATSTETAGGALDLNSLDTGDYNTEPRDFVAEGQFAGDFGPAVEGQRLAEFVVHPHDVDPTLVAGGVRNGVSVGGVGSFLQAGADDTIVQYGLISGFHSFRDNPEQTRELGIAVWRFPSEADAAGAAEALYLNALDPEDSAFSSGPQTPLTLDGLPGTYATTHLWETGTEDVGTFTPQGMFVISTYARDADADTAWLTSTTETAVQQQMALLDRFPPTPTEEIERLPVDVDKVLARSVGFVESENSRNSDSAVYGPDGFLHFTIDPVATQKIFDTAGVDRVAVHNSNVYRAGSNAAAEELRDGIAEIFLGEYPDLIEDTSITQELPGTTCWSGDTTQGRVAFCLMVHDRYMAELSGHRPIGNTDPDKDTLRTVPQRLGAQYTKFVRADELGLGKN